jgi:hypothetical protein
VLCSHEELPPFLRSTACHLESSEAWRAWRKDGRTSFVVARESAGWSRLLGRPALRVHVCHTIGVYSLVEESRWQMET